MFVGAAYYFLGFMPFFTSDAMNFDVRGDISFTKSLEESQSKLLSEKGMDIIQSVRLSNKSRAHLMLTVCKLGASPHIKHKVLELYTKGYKTQCDNRSLAIGVNVSSPMMYLLREAKDAKMGIKNIVAINPEQFFDEACRDYSAFSRENIHTYFKGRSVCPWYTPEEALYRAIEAKNMLETERILLTVPDIDARSRVGVDNISLYESVKRLAHNDESYERFKKMLESFCCYTLLKEKQHE